MMNMKEKSIDEMNETIDSFLNIKTIAVLGTLDEANQVYLSTLPVIKNDDVMYAYVSRTAPHFSHLQKNEVVQVMFSEDETTAANSYLAKRVSFNCTPYFIDNDEAVFQKLKEAHGDIINMLRNMDFELIKLTIIDGKAILGAGQAYYIDAKAQITRQDDGSDRK